MFWDFLIRLLSVLAVFSPESNFSCDELSEPISENELTDKVFLEDRRNHWDRPIRDATKPVLVTVRLAVQGLEEIDEKEEVVSLYGYLSMRWVDEFHVWNSTSSPLSCIPYIVVPHGEISGVWVPDVAFMNSREDKYELTHDPTELVRITSNGAVEYTPSGSFIFRCELDLTFFPFDTQICTMHFESWRYTKKHQIIGLSKEPISLVNLTKHDQWEIVQANASSFNVTYGKAEDSFSAAGHYVINVIAPSLIISLVESITFALDMEKGARLAVSFTCLLAYTVFQVMVVNNLPRSDTHPPLLSIYILLMIAFIAFAICWHGISYIVNANANGTSGMPGYLSFVFQSVAKLAGFPVFAFPKQEPASTTAVTTSCDGTPINNLEASKEEDEETIEQKSCKSKNDNEDS